MTLARDRSRKAPPSAPTAPSVPAAALRGRLEERVRDLEARMDSLGAPRRPSCAGCGRHDGVSLSHFSRGPGHLVEVRPLCASCRAPRASSR